MIDVRDPDSVLLEQDALQDEASEVAAELDLVARLARVGEPTRVGSAALGVMVRRDLDYTVTCAQLEEVRDAIAQLGAALAGHPQVRQVAIRDDTGRWNTDPLYPDGLYLGVQCRSARGSDWNLDLWFVDEPERQPDLAHLGELLPALTDEHRVAILQIKHARASRPEHRAATTSYDVYRAVLDDGVSTVEEFDAWAGRR